MANPPTGTRVKLWDVPVRIVHWSFVALLPAMWWTAEQGDIEMHRRLGYTMLALLVFRIYWGLAGGSTARFARFVKSPRVVAGYAQRLFRRDAEASVGHNPLGGWSVVALLAVLIAQVVVGLFTQDVDGLESGPLTYLISYDLADRLRGWHALLFNVLLGLIGLHLAAILFHLLVKRDDLISPMVTGYRRLPDASDPPTHATPIRGAIGVALAGAITWWVSSGCPLPG